MKLRVTRPDGTEIIVEGTTDEVCKLLRDEGLMAADAYGWPAAPAIPFTPYGTGTGAWPPLISSGTVIDPAWIATNATFNPFI